MFFGWHHKLPIKFADGTATLETIPDALRTIPKSLRRVPQHCRWCHKLCRQYQQICRGYWNIADNNFSENTATFQRNRNFAEDTASIAGNTRHLREPFLTLWYCKMFFKSVFSKQKIPRKFAQNAATLQTIYRKFCRNLYLEKRLLVIKSAFQMGRYCSYQHKHNQGPWDKIIS